MVSLKKAYLNMATLPDIELNNLIYRSTERCPMSSNAYVENFLKNLKMVQFFWLMID